MCVASAFGIQTQESMKGIAMQNIKAAGVRASGLLLAMAGAFLLAACDAGQGAIPIGEITKAGASFEGREVKIKGRTSQQIRLPFTDSKGYSVKDGSGEIVVWTTAQLPADGEEVVVRGRAESVAVIVGQSYGLSLKEIQRLPPGLRMPWQ
jgi:hypothetical protein